MFRGVFRKFGKREDDSRSFFEGENYLRDRRVIEREMGSTFLTIFEEDFFIAEFNLERDRFSINVSVAGYRLGGENVFWIRS